MLFKNQALAPAPTFLKYVAPAPDPKISSSSWIWLHTCVYKPTILHNFRINFLLQKKSNNEERRHLFQYKQKFDLSYAHYGVVKPLMGGSGYKDKVISVIV